MRFRPSLLFAAIYATALLSACSGDKDASKSNFAKVIDAKLVTQCVPLSFDLNALTSSTTFPISVSTVQPGPLTSDDSAKETNDRAFAQYDALVKVGLLSVVGAQVQPTFGREKVPGKVYSLTNEGMQSLKDPKYTAFCAGHYKVDEIVNFTEPGNAMGMTISRVTFTYSPVEMPAWANDEGVKAAFPAFAKRVSAHQQGRAVMALQNDGWSADLSSF
jgi:hypothetical protein